MSCLEDRSLQGRELPASVDYPMEGPAAEMLVGSGVWLEEVGDGQEGSLPSLAPACSLTSSWPPPCGQLCSAPALPPHPFCVWASWPGTEVSENQNPYHSTPRLELCVLVIISQQQESNKDISEEVCSFAWFLLPLIRAQPPLPGPEEQSQRSWLELGKELRSTFFILVSGYPKSFLWQQKADWHTSPSNQSKIIPNTTKTQFSMVLPASHSSLPGHHDVWRNNRLRQKTTGVSCRLLNGSLNICQGVRQCHFVLNLFSQQL